MPEDASNPLDYVEDPALVKQLSELVNQSGFPLQLGVQEAISAGYNKGHLWNPIAREVAWRSSTDGALGFVDLILGSGEVLMLLECKRSTNPWVFLRPTGERGSQETRDFRCLMASALGGRKYRRGVAVMQVDPKSIDSKFCVIEQKGSRHRLLEVDCAELVAATDAIAGQSHETNRRKSQTYREAYIPTIVTTAALYSCMFRAEKVSLQDGSIESPNFRPERWVRFTKSFSVRDDAPTIVGDDGEPERSVYIVHATEIHEFLRATGEFRFGDRKGWPVDE